MKKLFGLLLVVLIMLTFVACGGDTDEPVDDPTPEVTEAEEPADMEEEELPQEEVAEPAGNAVTVTYIDVSFSAPVDATIMGEENAAVGSALMVIYEAPDTGDRAVVALNGMDIEPAQLEELGEDVLLETLLDDDGEMVTMFGRNAVRNNTETGGHGYWFFNDALTIAYLLTVGDAEAGSDAAVFFEQVLNTMHISG